MSTDREPFNPTDTQLTEAARRQALLDVFGRGQGRPEEEEPDEEGRRNAQEARGDHEAGLLTDSTFQLPGFVLGHSGRQGDN